MTTITVAEISGNHGGEAANCVRLIREAKELSVSFIKFQCYEPEALAEKRKPLFPSMPAGELLGLYERNHTPRMWWRTIMEALDNYPWGVSVFSEADLKFILPYRPHYLKIASFELTDLALIGKCATAGKPMVLSVNHSATAHDVQAALQKATQRRRQPTILMATEYWGAAWNSTAANQAIAKEIQRYRWLADQLPPEIKVGLSDHLPPRRHAMASYATGKKAAMIERHLCLDGVETDDTPFSSNPEQFKEYMDVIQSWGEKDAAQAHAARG